MNKNKKFTTVPTEPPTRTAPPGCKNYVAFTGDMAYDIRLFWEDICRDHGIAIPNDSAKPTDKQVTES